MNVLKNIKLKKLVVLTLVSVLLLCGTGCDKIKSNVLDMLQGKPRETVRLTFPEGSTVDEMALILEEGGVCTAEEFRAQANNVDLLSEYGFVLENPQNRAFALEGYLFPDTYEFFVGEGAQSAIKRFLKNTQSKLGDDILKRCAQIGYTLDEILSIASIIQEEAGNPAEMGKVSSVLHNRLASAEYPKLQCDVSVVYLENHVKPYVSETEYSKLAELYSTYKCEGIPEGPITNPGLDAINAALSPEETPYYFFISDSEGVYHYAETYKEHLELCAEAGLI